MYLNLIRRQGQRGSAHQFELAKVSKGSWAKEIWRKFCKHKLAMIGGVILVIFYSMVILAPVLSPYAPNEVVKTHFFHYPTKIYFVDENGLTWPYVYVTENVGWGKYEEVTRTKYPLRFFVSGSEYRLFGLIPCELHLFGVDEPAHVFLLGTDNYGRDLFTRLLYGGRVSLFVGFIAILISTTIGLAIGGIAGYYGGWIDNFLMRLVEVFLSFPVFYLLLALASVLPVEMTSAFRFFLIIVILSFIGWAGLARVIRGIVLSVKENDFVMAAKAMGASDMRIIWRHILPTVTTYVIVSATLSIPGHILMESGLSFLGLGIQEPDASWGNMLNAAQSITKIVRFPWVLLPGVMIFITVLCYNLLGDGLRDVLDPKGKTRNT